MHRFFFTDRPLTAGSEVDLAPLARQVRQVLRMKPGDHIVLLDDAGHAFLTEIVACNTRGVRGMVVASQAAGGEPTVQLTLYQCSLKADRFEWVLQKGVELGVTRFVPLISERSVVRSAPLLAKRYGRWQAIVREAAEQCRRGRIPTIDPPQTLADAVAAAHGLRLLPWEESGGPGLAAAVRAQVEATIQEDARDQPPLAVSLLVGPEGGLSQAEVALAQEQGWAVVSLGVRILRAETAAVAAAAVIMAQLGELGSVGAPTAAPV